MVKLFINFKPEDIAYGGGNIFSLNFINYLKSKKVNIVYDLVKKIDIYFIIDPHRGPHKKYGLDDIVTVKKKYGGKIYIRVNDCDKTRPNVTKERSREHKILQHYKEIDYFIFNSDFIRNYYFSKYPELKKKKNTVIYNGGNEKLFYPLSDTTEPKKKLRIVTHHFSDNMNKGYDYYYKLFKFYENRTDYEFVFVGRKFNSSKPEYKQVPVIGPYKSKELSEYLRTCDIYVTGSKWDAGPMHVVEGILSGLPILYIDCDGGGRDLCELPKDKIGEKFSSFPELVDKIELIRENYNEYRKNVIKNRDLYVSSKCMEKYYKTIMDFKN